MAKDKLISHDIVSACNIMSRIHWHTQQTVPWSNEKSNKICFGMVILRNEHLVLKLLVGRPAVKNCHNVSPHKRDYHIAGNFCQEKYFLPILTPALIGIFLSAAYLSCVKPQLDSSWVYLVTGYHHEYTNFV